MYFPPSSQHKAVAVWDSLSRMGLSDPGMGAATREVSVSPGG